MLIQSSRLGPPLFPFLVCLAIAAWGCGGGNRPAPPVESNLKCLAVFYGRYIQQHRGQTPPNAEEFKKFITGLRPEELKAWKITDVDKAFASPRDGQPYMVRYAIALSPPGTSGVPVVAYEQQGVRGRRYIANALGAVEEVDEARFRQLVPQP